MAVGIVHGFEAVDIEEHQAQGASLAFGLAHLLGQGLVEEGSVVEAGQAVSVRLLLERLGLGFQGSDGLLRVGCLPVGSEGEDEQGFLGLL
jgi:hypothetical protein